MFSQLFGTPSRLLEQAYQAASKIKDIEETHFNGNRIPIDADNNSIPPNIKTEFEKHLSAAQLKIAEFKIKQSGKGELDANESIKLGFVEGFIAKYGNNSSNTSIVPVSTFQKSLSKSATPSPALSVSKSTNPVNNPEKKQTLLPKSISQTIDKIVKDLDPNAEEKVLEEFRRSRAQTISAGKFLLILIIVPILTHYLSKHLLVNPLLEKFPIAQHSQMFLNYEMKEEALKELHDFEEELKLESLIYPSAKISEEKIEKEVKEKAVEIAEEYRKKSGSALSNVFADLLSVSVFGMLLVIGRQQVAILKSFIETTVTGLSDSAIAFVIILVTDTIVGFHSPHGWEVLLEVVATHLGVPANESLIFLFIATVPVVMDTIVKYWIFRYLSRMSPSTMATLKEMNE